jgi:hypothetical protein
MALEPFFGPWRLFQFLNVYIVGRTLWMGDQPVARPLPIHRTTQTENKPTQISMPRVGFETNIRAGEDNLCLTPRGHCDKQSRELVSSSVLIWP